MTDFLNSFLGEPYGQYAGAFIALLVVLVLLILVLRIIKSLRGSGFSRRKGVGARLEVVEFAPIDDERHVVLVRRDNVEHLLLIGGQSDVVVEARIGAETETDYSDTQDDTPALKKTGKVSAALSVLTAGKAASDTSNRHEPEVVAAPQKTRNVLDEKNEIKEDELDSMMSELPWKRDA